MESEKFLFKYRRLNATFKQPKHRHQDSSVCTRYLSSANISISIQNKTLVPFPEISKSQAKLSFIDTYKNLDKVIDKLKHSKAKASPVSSYLTKIKENGLPPGTSGLLNKRKKQSLDISHYSIGNSYADALSEGIKQIQLTKAILKNNRLTDQGAFDIVSKLNPRYLTDLNLSENTVGMETITKICTIVEMDYSVLRVLNLDSNKLEDRAVVLMCAVLSNGDKIAELGLADNHIGEYGASALAKYIKTTQTLEKLDLHWNCIKGDGAKQLFESLSDNNSIKVLDLSWNALNSPSDANIVKSLAKAVKHNIKMYHLDLSNNCFTENECKVLAEALNFNTTLIGLHMDGNGAKIDCKGFLQLDIASSRARNLHIYKPLMRKKRRKDPNCWVCQRWNEVTVIVKPREKCANLMFHLELYNFEGEEMEKIADRSFRISKICPPGTVKFFFSSECEQVLCDEYKRGRFEKKICVAGMIIDEVQFVENGECSRIMWKEYCPRTFPRQILYTSDEKSWKVKNSVFRDYMVDNAKLLDLCFDYDLSLSTFGNLILESKDRIARLLKQNYLLIKNIHKHLYAASKSSWKLWQENMLDILSFRNIIDNSIVKSTDFTNILKLVKVSDSEVMYELARFQFLDLLVRIAFARYYRGGLITQFEAIEVLLKELSSIPVNFSSDEFRQEKFFCFAVDKALKKHLSWFVSYFAGHEQDGSLKFRDFLKIMAAYSKNEEFGIRCCYLAKETKRYMKYYETSLRFPEFLEAFCRVIDGERVDPDLKRLSLDVLIDIVISDYFKNRKSLVLEL